MKLAIIRQRYNPYGGAERFVDQALAALLENGVDVSLYTREWHPTKQPLLKPVICNPRYVGSTSRDRGFARAVCKALRRDPPDLVQAHERIACCDIFRAGDGVHRVWLDERRRGLGVWAKLGITLNPYHRYTLKAEAQLFASPKLRAVICNSDMVREEIKAHFGVADDKLHVIYNAVDAERFSPQLRAHRSSAREALHIPDDAVVFLSVGSGFARKGLASAIEALAELPAGAHLVAVGHDKHLPRYLALMERLGLRGRVHLVGAQRNSEPYYGAADVFVLPTIYDPCPNAAFEAMACALPVITTLKCGAAELVTAHGAGLVCPAGNVPMLTAHMGTLLDDDTRQTMGAAARAAACALTPEAMTRQLLLLYHRLLGTRLSGLGPASAVQGDDDASGTGDAASGAAAL